MFDPIVQKLNDEAISVKKLGGDISDRLLGINSENKKIYSGTGKYGPYIKIENR
jgi:topoisomerase IA-like protein